MDAFYKCPSGRGHRTALPSLLHILLFACVCLSLAHGASRRLLRVCGGAAVLCAAAMCAGGSGPHVAPERCPDWLALERLS